jgi:hypothetical protein
VRVSISARNSLTRSEIRCGYIAAAVISQRLLSVLCDAELLLSPIVRFLEIRVLVLQVWSLQRPLI